MTKPPTSVRSIRLPDAMWFNLQAQADSIGVSLNRYVTMRLESSVGRDLRAAAKVTARAAVPTTVGRSVTKDDVIVALTEPMRFPRAAPGSRLKGAKK